jgi:hypothetical protein
MLFGTRRPTPLRPRLCLRFRAKGRLGAWLLGNSVANRRLREPNALCADGADAIAREWVLHNKDIGSRVRGLTSRNLAYRPRDRRCLG